VLAGRAGSGRGQTGGTGQEAVLAGASRVSVVAGRLVSAVPPPGEALGERMTAAVWPGAPADV